MFLGRLRLVFDQHPGRAIDPPHLESRSEKPAIREKLVEPLNRFRPENAKPLNVLIQVKALDRKSVV